MTLPPMTLISQSHRGGPFSNLFPPSAQVNDSACNFIIYHFVINVNITICFVLYFLQPFWKRWTFMYPRIRALREDHDLPQKALAKILCCSQVCYSYYENGRRDIPTDVLITLSRFYDVSTDYLLGLTDRLTPYPASTLGDFL